MGGIGPPERLELHQWFSLKSSEVAAVYAGALHIIHTRALLPGREHFIAHAGREIWNTAMDLLLGPTSNPRPNDILNKLVQQWCELRIPQANSEDRLGVEIPRSLYQFIDRTCSNHIKHKTSRTRTVEFLRSRFQDGAYNIDDEADRIHHQITRFFPRITHVKRSNSRMVDWDMVVENFSFMEAILLAGIRPASETRRELDGVLDEANN